MHSNVLRSPLSVTFSLLTAACLTLSGCGGGGGGGSPEAASSAATFTPAVATPTAATVPDTASAANPSPPAAPGEAATLDQSLAQSMLASQAATETPPPAATALVTLSPTTAGAEVTQVEALAVSKFTYADTTPRQVTTTAGAAIYYVDSRIGNDNNNGLLATAGAAGKGPWRSLSKLRATSLAAGDSVRLTCGSQWAETLRLASSGTASKPITVAAYPAGCAVPPLINGGVAITAAQWRVHSGNIYKTTLASVPGQVYAANGTMTQAHHPNRGYDSTAPDSLYLRLAADSDSLLVNGRPSSSYLTTGSDLKLPTGATLGPGTQLRVRSTAWAIEDLRVGSVSGSRITLTARSIYPLQMGWGYYLLGQLWMLDSAGEWHYDAITRTLYAWMPDSTAPGSATAATQLATGVDLSALSFITIDGIGVQRVDTGVNLKSSIGVVLRNSRLQDITLQGIDATASQATTVDANTLTRIGGDAITGQDDVLPAASDMRVTGNNLSDIGVVMSGETALNLPRRTRAAIRPGANAVVSGNTINNTAYIGIWPLANATISNNVLYGTCTQLDDCGAIYVSGVNDNGTISSNLVQRSRGALAGKAPAAAYTQAQGIYLDDHSSGVKVTGNTVTDTDSGIHMHVASNNTISGNKLYGNRNNQLWMQETHNTLNRLGDLYGNTISGNQIAATSASARGLYLDTVITDTSRFGSFDLNRYFDTIYPLVAEERSPTQVTRYTLADWRAASYGGLPRLLDPNGSGTSQTRFASVRMNGSNIVPNTKLTTNAAGWTSWNATAPMGTFVREACTPGWCLRYVAGGSAGLLSSPNFSTQAGNWYRISFDAATGADGQLLNVLVRRGGGGSNSYEALSDRSLNVTAGRTWKRYSAVFMSTKTVNAADPLTLDLGARVDVQNVQPGQTISLANLELVPIVPAEALTRSDLLVNANANPAQASCPATGAQIALCAIYVRLSDNLPVTWPYYLGPRSSEIIYTRDARLVDSDGDGIPDDQDACARTAAGQAVNSRGCAMGQG